MNAQNVWFYAAACNKVRNQERELHVCHAVVTYFYLTEVSVACPAWVVCRMEDVAHALWFDQAVSAAASLAKLSHHGRPAYGHIYGHTYHLPQPT